MPVDRNRYSCSALRLCQSSVSLPCFILVSENILVFGVGACDAETFPNNEPPVVGGNIEVIGSEAFPKPPNVEVVEALGSAALPNPPNIEVVEVCPAEAFDTAGVAGAPALKGENRFVPAGAAAGAAWLVLPPA